mgnify:CR=1 FL=1
MISQDNLYILDMANNHFGDVEHAKRMIDELAGETRGLEAEIVIKFQLRDLDSFIHKDFKDRLDLKFVRRFQDTRLEIDELIELNHYAKTSGFMTMATAFDEASTETFRTVGYDYAKIASVSSSDFDLVQAIVDLKKPTVASTGGLREKDIVQLHSILESSGKPFAVMHCVSIYPSPEDSLNLRQIQNLRQILPTGSIGWSTHEDPENMIPAVLAKSLGSTVFERHVGLQTSDYPLNGYSSSPIQVKKWIMAVQAAEKMLGSLERPPINPEERRTLASLNRSYYSRYHLEAGREVSEQDLYLAFPNDFEDGVEPGKLIPGSILRADLEPDQALRASDLIAPELSKVGLARDYALEVQSILRRSKVAYDENSSIVLSHHYGLERFREFGAAFVTCVNRNYAKKIIVVLPRQKHPVHFHDMKEESFQLLWGDAQITIDGKKLNLKVGQLVTVYPRQWHKFTSLNGCVLEELSTHHSGSDSYYEDERIQKLSDEGDSRKTEIKN